MGQSTGEHLDRLLSIEQRLLPGDPQQAIARLHLDQKLLFRQRRHGIVDGDDRAGDEREPDLPLGKRVALIPRLGQYRTHAVVLGNQRRQTHPFHTSQADRQQRFGGGIHPAQTQAAIQQQHRSGEVFHQASMHWPSLGVNVHPFRASVELPRKAVFLDYPR
ncbi:hypothetical protein Q427_08885 [Halomonas sp. BC04]|nr:hypothetical protein Q427_08885 [Halomonas sp. BC04]